MSDLENLRKQAKQLVRWHRTQHFPVAQILRDNLYRFANLDDRSILSGPFQLAEAQAIIAKQNGFDNWKDLTMEHAPPKIPSEADSSVNVISAEPQLFVRDINVAVQHYNRLGFEIVFTYGEPSFYCQVKRGGAALNLRLVHEPVIDPVLARSEEYGAATITVEHAKSLYLEFAANGVEFYQKLRKEPWGARTFIVQDPAGNLILFAGS